MATGARQAIKSELGKKVKKDLGNAALNVVADTIAGKVISIKKICIKEFI